ncbi:hypothetical protein ABAC460_17300 [Asticcacaulis sp. AC460]|uniref:ParB/RepB/Spo0J family partition protein n=1 Tax=Asticcacaulis sp. AC460 TaxID=1282360 RepID=UPI0003C3EE62|nr:hypothetical protein [Asticcacaulis sp. AC460]ESQ87948.1 hypothetical protein ABAC460_17300 [Asticcacaulis sp. AC460]
MNPQASQLSRVVVALKDLDIAPENPRFLEPADELIPDLAQSLAPDAAGQLLPLLVRKGGKKEKPYMALDGRRRLLGFRMLLEQGLITNDLEITTELCETQEAIAAALVTANGARLPVGPADKILAIRAMADKKFSVDKIARGLCMDLAEVKKFQVVSRVHLDAITAFKTKFIDFNTLKMIARIPTLAEQEAVISKGRQYGHLSAGQVRDYLDQEGLSAASSMMKIVGVDAYVEAGGKVSTDLLNELPDMCLDTPIAASLWAEKLQPLRDLFEGLGITTLINPDSDAQLPEEFGDPGYRYSRSKEEREALAEAQAKLATVREALPPVPEDGVFEVTGLAPFCKALFDQEVARLAPMPVRAVLIVPGDRTLLEFKFHTYVDDISAWEESKRAALDATPKAEPRVFDTVPERKILIDTDGESNAFHRLATEMAVRGLQCSLAGSFSAALKLQVCSMFEQVVLSQQGSYIDDRALKVSYTRNIQAANYGAVEGLDQGLVQRLLEFKDAYAETGLRPYAWVSSLAFGQIQELLALTTAASLWITEDATNMIRKKARALMQEVAEEIDHDIRTHWFPSADFYAKCSKKQLLGFADRMGCEGDTLGTMKKAALASYIAEQGVAHQWVPAALSFDNNAELEAEDDAADADSDDAAGAGNVELEGDEELEPEEEPVPNDAVTGGDEQLSEAA